MVEEPPSPSGDPSDPDASPDDPLAWLTLDERFIAAATRAEPSAAERARAAREANLVRLLADEAAHRENVAHAQRRFAPSALVGARRSGRGRSGRGRGGRSRSDRRQRWRSIAFAALGVAALLVMAVEVRRGSSLGLSNTGEAARPSDWPPVAEQVSTTPLGAPGPVPAGGGTHTFLAFQPDGVTPVAYDPCRPIHYVTRPGGPEGGAQLVREAVAEVSAATGLEFVDDGATDEAPSDERPPFQPDRYGQRWAPVLITWSDPAESPRLGTVAVEDPTSDVAGFAGSVSVGFGPVDDAGSTMVYVSGSLTLDAPDLTELLSRPDGWAAGRAVVEHELGHLVGLDHVDDATQIMFPTATPGIAEYGAGDLEGLAALGRGACFPDV